MSYLYGNTKQYICSFFSLEQEEEETKAAEEKAAELEANAGQPKKIEYIHPIRVQCGIAVTGLEWTTEVTDKKLNTTTTTSESEFEPLGIEIDPR